MIILIDNKELIFDPDLRSIISKGDFKTIQGTFTNTFTIQIGEHNKNLLNNKNKS